MKLKAFVNLLTAGSTVGFPLSCIGVLYWKTDFFKQENSGAGKNNNSDDFIKKEQEQKSNEAEQQTPSENNALTNSQTTNEASEKPTPEVAPASKDSVPTTQTELQVTPSNTKSSDQKEDAGISLPMPLPDVNSSSSDNSNEKSSNPATVSTMTPEKLSKWIQVVINKVVQKKLNLEKNKPKNTSEIEKCKKTINTLKQLKKLVEEIKVSVAEAEKVITTITTNP